MSTIEFNGVTKLDSFLERDDATRLFPEIIQEITWLQCDFNSPSCASSYLYGGQEKQLAQKPSLDDLTCIVETVLETKVSKVWMWCYGDGRDHMCYRNIGAGQNLLHLFIGTTRKLFVKGNNERSKMYKMKHGDALYVPKERNDPHFHCSIPDNDNIESCTIHICFLIKDPYSFRHRDAGIIHLLGRGPVEVTYDTRVYPEGLPPDITATVLPSLCVPADSNRGNLSLLSQPQIGLFAGIAFTQESFEDLHLHLDRDET